MDNIKKAAGANGTKIQSSEAAHLEKVFNRMFYLDKDIKEETKFVKQMMTRGTETQERRGLHASALIVGDKQFCVRQQVLSLIYKQIQRANVPVGLMRIFEEGNAIHEKWQRLFIRAGYGQAINMDISQLDAEFDVSFTPDAILVIPELNKYINWNGPVICEIKSVNTFQFKKMTSHPSGLKQIQLYMHLTGIHKGFVLCDDKNTQDFKIFMYDYEPEIVSPFIERMEAIKFYKDRAFEEGRMVKRANDCNKSNCKRASDCVMKDACWGIGMGKVKL